MVRFFWNGSILLEWFDSSGMVRFFWNGSILLARGVSLSARRNDWETSIMARLLGIAGLLALALTGCGPSGPTVEILNVSYDPTRELYRKLNQEFIKDYQKNGVTVKVRQSHGGSGSQARSVIDGIPADVVSLALWSDTNQLAKRGLIAKDWEKQIEKGSLPYFSTIVFVVRKGNPKGIKDWPDLVKDGVKVIGPNPKTSGGAKLNLLAAWGAVLKEHNISEKSTAEERAKAEEAAREFVTKMYKNCPVLDSGARGSTITFARRMIGDVHVTWENEAWLEKQELPDELEIIYPEWSFKAEPHVAIVDVNVDRKGTRDVAKDYLEYLHSEKAQEIIAENGFRPTNPAVAEKHKERFKSIKTFGIDYIDAGGWDAVQKRFFADGGLFDQIYQPGGD